MSKKEENARLSVAALISQLVEKDNSVKTAEEFKEKYMKDFAKSLKYYKSKADIPEELTLTVVKPEMATIPQEGKEDITYAVVRLTDGNKEYRMSLMALYKGLDSKDNTEFEQIHLTLRGKKEDLKKFKPSWSKKDSYYQVAWDIAV